MILGRRMRLSSSVSTGKGGLAPGSRILLCGNFSGSLNETHHAKLGSISSRNKLSGSGSSIRSTPGGGRIFVSVSSIGYNSLLSGGRKDPLKPPQPYAAASFNCIFGSLAVRPLFNTLDSLPHRGWDECTYR